MNTPRITPTRIDTTSHARSASQTPSTTQRMRLGRGGSPGSWAMAICGPSYRSRSPRSRWLLRVIAGALGLALLAASGPADAEPARLDVHRGPLVASSRITGLAGAFTGVAEGVDGALRNPAALANRSPRSTAWFDYDLTLDWLITTGDGLDYDTDGQTIGAETAFNAINAGLELQLGPLAVGALGAFIGYRRAGDRPVNASLSDVLLGVAWAFDEGGVIAGLGVNLRAFDIEEPAAAAAPHAHFVGPSWDLGLLLRPRDLPWRLGAQLRLGARAVENPDIGDASALSPGRQIAAVVAPVQLAVGVSYLRAADPGRRYNAPLRAVALRARDGGGADRRYLLLSADLVYTGVSKDAYNIEGFLEGDPVRAGARGALSVHLGAEGEVIGGLLRARVGSYLEPTRVEGAGYGRLHLTGGAEVKLFRLWRWPIKATFAFDVASRWTNVTLGLGVWN